MSESTVSSARSLGASGWLLAAGAAFVIFFAGLGAFPLIEPDEGRYAEIPREMLATGDFVTPRLNGVLYFEKPPLYYWLNAASMAVLGPTETACRLAGAFLGLGGLGLAWAIGRSMGGRGVGLLAAVFLGTAPLYVALSRATTIDMTLSFFLSATLVCFWLAQGEGPLPRPSSPRPSSPAPSPPPSPGEEGAPTQQQERFGQGPLSRGGGWGGRERGRGEGLGWGRSAARERLLWYGMFAAAALATLAKGLIGFVIPGAVIFFFLLFARRWAILRRVPWVGGILLFLAIAVPWHVLAARRNPDFLWFYFVHEHVLRYATPEADREAPLWFFVPVLLLGLLPWSGLFPAAAGLFRRGAESRRRRPEVIFLACWAGFVFLFFSASHSKLVPYVMPACLPLAVLAALAFQEAKKGARVRSWVRGGAITGAVVLVLLSAPFLWAALGKVPQYSAAFSPLLFVFSLLAIAAGALAAVLWWRRGAAGRGVAALAVASVLFIACLWAIGPRVGRQRSSREMARFLAARLRPGDEVYAYHYYPQTLPVYLGRTIGIAHFRGELAFGIDHLPPAERLRRFPWGAEFRPVWDSPRTVYLVLERQDLHHLAEDGLIPGPILLGQDKLLLMTNHPQAAAPETHE
ncbi:MAG TPA: glycosyltransferase family 39 protein [Thermoanaerobaculia bacterium]|nr:glycosyltransferase family 39 protein [Thermoanaerobaculia bacterium]